MVVDEHESDSPFSMLDLSFRSKNTLKIMR